MDLLLQRQIWFWRTGLESVSPVVLKDTLLVDSCQLWRISKVGSSGLVWHVQGTWQKWGCSVAQYSSMRQIHVAQSVPWLLIPDQTSESFVKHRRLKTHLKNKETFCEMPELARYSGLVSSGWPDLFRNKWENFRCSLFLSWKESTSAAPHLMIRPHQCKANKVKQTPDWIVRKPTRKKQNSAYKCMVYLSQTLSKDSTRSHTKGVNSHRAEAGAEYSTLPGKLVSHITPCSAH